MSGVATPRVPVATSLRADRLPGAAATPSADASGAAFAARLHFTGRGDEYFRIWVVNLFLTVLTLGVYSAWAKVRKTRYFWQNTRLDGHVFDFHGRPLAILRGRILALVLLVAYSYGFQFSRAAGYATVALLLALGPWLFVKAQQFKFGNTSHRGLRFGFDATARDGYRIVTPILLIWFSSTLAAAVLSRYGSGLFVALSLASLANVALLPWMHHRLKGFQHARATYGERQASWEPALRSFYGVYLKGALLVVVGALAGGALLTLLVSALMRSTEEPPAWLWQFTGSVAALVIYVTAYPYLAARLQQVVWAHTTLDDVRFRTEIAARPLFRIVFKNVLLTIVTFGLYWPYAAVAIARYRVDCMQVLADAPFASIAAGTRASGDAVGDAAADTFGFELGL